MLFLASIPADLVGVWAATAVPRDERRWLPETPLEQPAHYFLVIRKAADGRITAFIRNPEFNSGSQTGTTPELPIERDGDGQIIVPHASIDGQRLVFHRLASNDERWFYPRPTSRWSYEPPQSSGDGWDTASLADVGMQIGPLAQYFAKIVGLREPVLRSPYIQSVSIARHGKLVVDEYFYGFSSNVNHDVRSAGKSVTALLAGKAIERSRRFDVRSRVLDLVPQYRDASHVNAWKRAITLEDLLTMRSGLACDDNDDASPGNEDTMQTQTGIKDWYRYTLDLPMAHAPGTFSAYCTAGMNLVGAVVSTQMHVAAGDMLIEDFLKPMQMRNYALWLMPAPQNAAYMGGGDYYRPRDFLKFGELFLKGGRWNGVRIIDRAWLDTSIIPRSSPEEGSQYGYGWYLSTVTVDDRTFDVINAGGNGGQLLIVVPALDITIMITAGNYNQFPVWRAFTADILTAVARSCQ